jgi:hypothetical protein
LSNAADFVQLVQAIPQWGVWFTLSVFLIFVVGKIFWGYGSEKTETFINRQKENNDLLHVLIDGAHVWDSDPPRYVGTAEILKEVLQNRKLGDVVIEKLIEKCALQKCPHHEMVNETMRLCHEQIMTDMRDFHTKATAHLVKFSSDADLSRAETKLLVEGIANDVRLLHQHTLPLIATIVERINQPFMEKKGDSNRG